jgi:hypothetical protein
MLLYIYNILYLCREVILVITFNYNSKWKM